MKWSRSLLAAFLLVVSTPAYAADPVERKSEKAALTAQAAALYDQGTAAYKEQKWPEARAAFLAAWALEKHWQIAANLADAEIQVGRHREAAEHAFFYRQKAPADRHERAEALLAKAKARVVTLRIETDPPGADVWIDGQPAGRTPLAEPFFLEPGKHTVTARMASRPEAAVTLDKGAGTEEVVRLEVKAAQIVTPPPPPPPAPKSMVPAYVLGGAGIAGLVVGATLTGVAYSDASQARAQAPRDAQGALLCSTRGPEYDRGGANQAECNDLRSLSATASDTANAGLGLMIAGGVLGAGAGVYFLWAKAPVGGGRPATAIVPVVGSTGGGVIWQGSF